MRLYPRIISLLAARMPAQDAAVLIQRLAVKVSLEDAGVYRICNQFVNAYRSENNDDIRTNGELRFMKERLDSSQLVFDVGANVGKWAALALEINPDLRLHCFEPSKPTFQRLVANNFPKTVTCNNIALGSVPGEKTLYVFEEGSGINSLYERRGLEDGWNLESQKKKETIRIETLDWYCAQHSIAEIDFLKLDVEGHELEVFRGAKEALETGRIKAIQFEYGGCNIDARVLLRDVFEFFQSYRYSFYKIYPGELRRVARYDQRLENFQYQNWAILRKE